MPDDRKIIVTREKHFLYFTLPDSRCDVRYDLNEQVMQYFNKDRVWETREKCYSYFNGFSINDLSSEEEHFVKLIENARRLNCNCTHLSTFISRLGESLVGEQYSQAGIEFECSGQGHYSYDRKNIITKPLNYYPKQLITLFKKSNFKVTTDFEDNYIENEKLMGKLVNILFDMQLDNEQIKDFLNHCDNYGFRNFVTLINEYNYDIKSLLNFIYNYLIPFENLSFSNSSQLLRDYYRMGSEIGRKLKRYPKYLKSMHDIITSNYNAYQKEYDEQQFQEKINYG